MVIAVEILLLFIKKINEDKNMGLDLSYMNYIQNELVNVFGENWNGLTMLELGNQHITQGEGCDFLTGKDYYSNKGFEHISIDMNGEDGALPLDLRNPDLFAQYFNSVDVLTNSGTTEHVEPYETQYECFSILHNCVKVGGIMIHIVPDVYELDNHGSWAGHCTNYYCDEFFTTFAKDCGYEVLSSTVIRGNRAVCLKKTLDLPFMQDRQKFLSLISVR